MSIGVIDEKAVFFVLPPTDERRQVVVEMTPKEARAMAGFLLDAAHSIDHGYPA